MTPAAARAQDTIPARIEVVGVEFEGRDALALDLLEGAVATHPSTCRSLAVRPLCWLGVERTIQRRYLDEAEALRDAERLEVLYELWGYPLASARTDIRVDGDEARVHFLIREGAPLRVASLEVHAPPGLRLSDQLPLRVGAPYALPLLDASLDRLRWDLAQQGYPYAEINVGGAVDRDSLSATLTLDVRPGPLTRFGVAHIRAASPLDEDVVRERLAFVPGDPYSDVALERTERSLYRLPAMGRAVARPEPEPLDSTVVPVVVDVAPRRLHGFEGEGTLSSTDCLELGAFWTHRYFMGGPRVLSIGGAVSNLLAAAVDGAFPCVDTGTGAYGRVDYEARASLSQPLPGLPQTDFFLELFGERHSTPGVFVQTGFGGRLRVSHALDFARTTAVSLQYVPARYELSAADLYFCANYGVCERGAIDAVAGAARLAPLGLTVTHRSDAAREGLTVDKLPLWRQVQPARWRLHMAAGVEAADGWTGSDFTYERAFLEVAPTRRIGTAWEIATRLRAAALFDDGVVPPQSRLFAGGPGSIRAVGNSQFGPATLVADPSRLEEIGCAPATAGCPEELHVRPDDVKRRPLGAHALAEASVEARRWLGDLVQVAAFVDVAAMWQDAPWQSDGADAHVLAAPGIGVRLIANIGAIRLDLAYDPRGAERLPLRSAAGADGSIIDLGTVVYDRYGYDDPGFFRELLRRLQLQVAVGQPF